VAGDPVAVVVMLDAILEMAVFSGLAGFVAGLLVMWGIKR